MKPIAHVHVLDLIKAGCSVNFYLADPEIKPEPGLIQEPELVAQVSFPDAHGSVLMEALSMSTVWVSPKSPSWRRALLALAALHIPHSVNEAVRDAQQVSA